MTSEQAIADIEVMRGPGTYYQDIITRLEEKVREANIHIRAERSDGGRNTTAEREVRYSVLAKALCSRSNRQIHEAKLDRSWESLLL